MSLNEEIRHVLTSYALPENVIQTIADEMARLDENQVAPGLSVGERGPDFDLPDPQGDKVSLAARLEKGPVVLSFFRGDWCPICNLQLRALERALLEIGSAGGSLIAVTPQSLEHTLSLQEKADLNFEILSDVDQRAIRDYRLQFRMPDRIKEIYLGILGVDISQQNADGSWNLPVPGTFVIDQEGTVRKAHVTADYTRRMEPEDVVAALHKLAKAA